MRLNCPECGAEIQAEKINVQEMVAVCGACNYVFRFDVDEAHRKRRKLKKPKRLHITETPDQLTMHYQMVSNEDEWPLTIGNAPFALLLPLAIMFTIMARMPYVVPLFFTLWAIASWYVQAAIWFNKTTIGINDERLSVESGPIPWVTTSRGNIERQDIEEIICVETKKSQENAAVNRYFHVQVKLIDGHNINILKAMPQDYALYIAQELNAELKSNQQTSDVSRLEDFFEEDNNNHATNGHNTASANGVN